MKEAITIIQTITGIKYVLVIICGTLDVLLSWG